MAKTAPASPTWNSAAFWTKNSAEKHPHSRSPFHSREGGNLPIQCASNARTASTIISAGRALPVPPQKQGDSRLRGNGRRGGNGNSFFGKKRILTLRRLRGGVRARSGRGGWSISYDCRHFATPQKFAGANFYPPPQAAEGKKILPFRRKPESLRRSRIRQRRPMQCPASRNILAYRPPPSIPAKAGISAAKPHSPKATDAMFRFAEYSRYSPPLLPFPRRRESLRRSRIRRRRPMQCSTSRNILAIAPPSFHSREGGNLCGEAAFAKGDRCNVPLRGIFSLSRE